METKTQKAKNFLCKGDFLDEQINLTIKGGDNYSTIPGCILSVLMILTLTVVTFKFGSEFFDSKNPDLNYNFSREKEFPHVNLLEHKLMPVIAIYDSDIFKLIPKNKISHIYI